MFDQPLAVITQMEVAHYTAEAFRERASAAKAGKLIEWAEANPEKLRWCRDVEELLEIND